MKHNGILVFCVCGLILSACSESLDMNKKMNELDSSDGELLCDEREANNNMMTDEEVCKLIAIAQADQSMTKWESACQFEFERCMDVIKTTRHFSCSFDVDIAQASTCDVTVDEYLTCDADTTNQQKKALANWTCEEGAAPEINAADSCDVVASKCS